MRQLQIPVPKLHVPPHLHAAENQNDQAEKLKSVLKQDRISFCKDKIVIQKLQHSRHRKNQDGKKHGDRWPVLLPDSKVQHIDSNEDQNSRQENMEKIQAPRKWNNPGKLQKQAPQNRGLQDPPEHTEKQSVFRLRELLHKDDQWQQHGIHTCKGQNV